MGGPVLKWLNGVWVKRHKILSFIFVLFFGLIEDAKAKKTKLGRKKKKKEKAKEEKCLVIWLFSYGDRPTHCGFMECFLSCYVTFLVWNSLPPFHFSSSLWHARPFALFQWTSEGNRYREAWHILTRLVSSRQIKI